MRWEEFVARTEPVIEFEGAALQEIIQDISVISPALGFSLSMKAKKITATLGPLDECGTEFGQALTRYWYWS